jgi:hypothetical protein
VVDRRLFCIEALSEESVEQKGMQILVEVRSNFPENGKRRKGAVSLAITISQGLVST